MSRGWRSSLFVLLMAGLTACAGASLEAPPPRPAEAVADLADAGDADAQVALGMMYEAGDGVPRDLDLAADLYRLAAEQGNALGQYALAELYARGRGVPQDDAQAVTWFRAAAEQGDPAAQFRLGYHYEHGLGVPQDYAEAARWYARAREGWRRLGAPPPGIERLLGVASEPPTLHAPPRRPAPAPAPLATPVTTAPARETAPGTDEAVGEAASPAKPAAAAAGPAAGEGPEARAPAVSRGRLGGIWVHVASFRSPQAALRFAERLEAEDRDLIGALQVKLARVNLGETLGEWVRVRIGPLAGRADASALCERFRARDLYCAPLAN